MQADNPSNGAKADDRQAVVDWFRNYETAIARFAYQAGVPKEKIGAFQVKLINAIHEKLEISDDENAENILYKKAVHLIEGELAESNHESDLEPLKFEEDQETHMALLQLPLQERLAVILVHFHGKQLEDAASILMIPLAAAEFDIQSGLEKLRNELAVEAQLDVERRLDLLEKSYNRIEFSTAAENIEINKLPADVPNPETKSVENKPVKKKTFALLAGASLFLTAIIGASFLFNDQPADTQQAATDGENPTTVSKEMVKDWEAQYEEIRSSAPERLGLPVDTFESLEYVQKADALRERTFSRQNVKQLQDDPERMQDQVDILMQSIETPKGMLDSVKDDHLNPAEISKFLVIYTEKTDQLMVIADNLLEKHKDELAAAERDGVLSPDMLMHSRVDYPEDIENLTAALREYTFQYAVHPNDNRFRTVRDVNKFYEVRPFSTDGLSNYYMEVIRSAPYYDETGLLLPIEQLPFSVMTMAGFLTDPMLDPALRSKVEPLLANSFFTMVKGDFNTEVFDSNGVVKEEFRIAWETSMQMAENPIIFVLLPILEEFKASGWTESAHFDQLALPDILAAIEMERNGELEAKLPNGDVEIEFASLQLADYDYSDIKPFYEEFSASHDLDMLSGVEPLEIIKLYYYANKIEDIETMWHLTADDKLKPSLEEYTKRWRKQPEITETRRSIEIYEDNTTRQGSSVVLIVPASLNGAHQNFQFIRDTILITERDQIWLMQHQMDEFYTIDENFEEFDSNVQAHYNNLLQNDSLETVDTATPAEIAGIFLLALEKEDIRTMRLLLNKGEMQVSDEEFKERWILSGQFGDYSKMEGISFRADTYNPAIKGVQGYVDIYENISTRENGHFLPLEKVGDSWMIGDMFNH
ncbi:sigma-70 family RNA polymerase sigma factor [Planococcus sp. X10-3]|uniref:sigma-70 family RNA polymerase sigma factor n=1 Tax=Planococcus sp. X10-3 TaxID=3061240 RepID=UPI003BB04698